MSMWCNADMFGFIYREFLNPSHEPDGVLATVGRLRHEVERTLQSRATAKFTMYFSHAVYHFLFIAKGKKAERKDSVFSRRL